MFGCLNTSNNINIKTSKTLKDKIFNKTNLKITAALGVGIGIGVFIMKKHIAKSNIKENSNVFNFGIFGANNKEIAILHATKYGFHKLPGGGFEKGENKEIALKREIKEELGCEIEIIGEIGKIIEIKNKYGHKQDSFCYVAEVSNNCQANLTHEEKNILGIEIKWISLKKAI